MPERNNITRLGSGRRSGSATSQLMNISANRYIVRNMNDPAFLGMKRELISYVSTFNHNDKIRILQEYMDLSEVGKKDLRNIDELLADAMLIHMDPDELDRIIRRVKASSQAFSRQLSNLETKSRRVNQSAGSKLMMADVHETYKDKRFRSTRAMLKASKPALKVPRSVTSGYSSLRRELNKVLQDFYTNASIIGLANKMGLEIVPDVRDLKKHIIDKTILYVSIVLGKVKDLTYAASITDVTPYNDLLQYTSMAYVTGKPGLTNKDVMKLRKEATEAKQARDRASRGRTGRLGLFDIRGRRIRRSLAGALLDDYSEDTLAFKDRSSILANVSDNDLINIAYEHGIDPSKYRNFIDLRIAIISEMAKKHKELNKIESSGTGVFGRMFKKFRRIDPSVSMRAGNLRSSLDAIQGSQQTSSKEIPVVTFNDTGSLASDNILKAVPVYIVGQGNAGVFRTRKTKNQLTREAFKKRRDDRRADIKEALKWENGGIFKNLFSAVFKKRDLEIGDELITGPSQVTSYGRRISGDSELKVKGNRKTGYDVTQAATRLGVTKILKGPASPVFVINSPRLIDREIKISDINSEASTLGLNQIKDNVVTPVYTVNAKDTSTLDYLKSALPNMMIGLQMAGVAVNAAAGMGAVMKGTADLDTFTKYQSSLLGFTPLHAEGGKGKASKANVSQFVSGDSLTSKPNPELVSINYDTKSYSVKPIPAYATGGSPSGSGAPVKMTPHERNAPLSIGLSSHLVSYNRQLEGVNDDGTGKALKVYNIKPGINDPVEIGGVNVSLMELMARMSTTLRSIEDFMQSEVQLSSVIASNTGATAVNTKKSNVSPFSGGSFPGDLNSILQGV